MEQGSRLESPLTPRQRDKQALMVVALRALPTRTRVICARACDNVKVDPHPPRAPAQTWPIRPAQAR